MLTTAIVDGKKITISEYHKEEGKEAFCPLGHKLIAKKGRKVIHHFAHAASEKCDPWRKGMTNWHSQWQKIVLDKSNVEVCLDPNGVIVGNSSFHGGTATSHVGINSIINNNVDNNNNAPVPVQNPLSQSSIMAGIVPAILNPKSKIGYEALYGSESHIADLIKPMFDKTTGAKTRPCVIEIQNSPIDKDTIDSREAYYKDIIWLFNLTPRVVDNNLTNNNNQTNKPRKEGKIRGEGKEKYNRIVFVDGKISYLKEKVSYVALITAANRSGYINNDVYYSGDECLGVSLTPIGGTFVIINTRTKHWYETNKPTYFDCGFGILRMLRKLDKGFAFTMYLSYEEFIIQRMPEIDVNVLRGCEWFHSLGPISMVKLNVMPKAIDVPGIMICDNKVVIKYEPGTGSELSGLGMEQGMDNWHGGEFYQKIDSTQTNSHSQPSSAGSNAAMLGFMNQAVNAVMLPTNIRTIRPAIINESMIIAKLRRYLCASNSLHIEIVNLKGVETLIVNCLPETYNMKDKFKALGMLYKKKSAKKTSAGGKPEKKNSKAGRGNITTLSDLRSEGMESMENLRSKTNAYYYVKVEGLDAKITSQLG